MLLEGSFEADVASFFGFGERTCDKGDTSFNSTWNWVFVESSSQAGEKSLQGAF